MRTMSAPLADWLLVLAVASVVVAAVSYRRNRFTHVEHDRIERLYRSGWTIRMRWYPWRFDPWVATGEYRDPTLPPLLQHVHTVRVAAPNRRTAIQLLWSARHTATRGDL